MIARLRDFFLTCADCGAPIRWVHRFPDGVEPDGYKSHSARPVGESTAPADLPSVEADVQHALVALNAASDKAIYGDSFEGDLLEAHATLDSLLTRLRGEQG